MLVPHISTILNVYLKLMSQIDLEDMILGLEYLVKYFNTDIINYANELFNELYKAFVRMIQTQIDNDEGAAQLAAGGVLKTMDKLLEITANSNIFPVLEEKVSEVIKWGLTPQAWEMQEDIFAIIFTIVKTSKNISSRSWNFYPELLETVLGTNTDILNFKKDFPNQTYEGNGYDSISEIIQIILQMTIKYHLLVIFFIEIMKLISMEQIKIIQNLLILRLILSKKH